MKASNFSPLVLLQWVNRSKLLFLVAVIPVCLCLVAFVFKTLKKLFNSETNLLYCFLNI